MKTLGELKNLNKVAFAIALKIEPSQLVALLVTIDVLPRRNLL